MYSKLYFIPKTSDIYLNGILWSEIISLILIKFNLGDDVRYHAKLAEIYHVVLVISVTILSVHYLRFVDSCEILVFSQQIDSALDSENLSRSQFQ